MWSYLEQLVELSGLFNLWIHFSTVLSFIVRVLECEEELVLKLMKLRCYHLCLACPAGCNHSQTTGHWRTPVCRQWGTLYQQIVIYFTAGCFHLINSDLIWFKSIFMISSVRCVQTFLNQVQIISCENTSFSHHVGKHKTHTILHYFQSYNISPSISSSIATVEEVFRSFTWVKVAVLQCKNTLLQVKVLHSTFYLKVHYVTFLRACKQTKAQSSWYKKQ